MPMSRYQVRNEYSLADPELYRAADKDDPEALLEGVAMAGLVGVLRQLGDLAEFAAEIFHDLHEEVMITASRGHDLMVRVQEIEAEVPSIERAFLFQTDHSSFFYNPGVDWHSNVRENKNLVACGDMPRFIMNSYDECRGPPRLFLLDKYDIGGAGACLKRYTDPAFFKVETSMRTGADGMPNYKLRKAKKKGTHLNNEDAAALMRSNPKLHQLFLEEPIVKGVNKPARVKLKRKLKGFPFDTKSEKSYMEKLFLSPMEHQIPSDPDIYDVRSVSPVRKSIQRIRNHSRPDEVGSMQNQLIHDNNDVPTDKTFQGNSSYSRTNGIAAIVAEEDGETDIHVDGERKQGSNLIHMQRDIVSEIDDQYGTPSAMDLEEKTDSDLQVTNDITSSFFEGRLSVLNHENFHSQPSDFNASTSLIMSEEDKNSARSEHSSSISPYRQRTLARSSLTEEKDEFSLEIIDKNCSVDQVLEPSAFHDNYSKNITINKKRHNPELPNSFLQSTEPLYSLPDSDEDEVSSGAQKGYVSSGIASDLQYNEKESDLILHSLAPPRTLSTDMQLQVNSSMFSPRECILSESNSVNSPSKSMFSSNTCDVLHRKLLNGDEIIPSSDMVRDEFGHDIQDIPVDVPCNFTETEDCDGGSTPSVYTKENQEKESDDIYDSRKNLMESYSTHIDIDGTQYHCSSSSLNKQVDSEKNALVGNETRPNAPDTYDGPNSHADIDTSFPESPFFSGDEKSLSSGETNDSLTKDSVDLHKSCDSLRNFVDATEPSDFVENPVSRLADSELDVLVDDQNNPDAKQVDSEYNTSCRVHAETSFAEEDAKNTASTKNSNGFFGSEIRFEPKKSLTIQDSDLVDVTWNLPSQQHSLFDKDHDSFLQSDDRNEISYAKPLFGKEEAVIQERKTPPFYQVDEKFIDSSEAYDQGNLVNDVSGYPKESSNLISPIYEENQITLEETPPLPPLPPFKWRMGKFPHFPTASRENADKPHSAERDILVPSIVEDVNFSNPYAHDANPKVEPMSSSAVLPSLMQQVFSAVESEDLNPNELHHPPEISTHDASSATSNENIKQSSSVADCSPINAIYIAPERESKEQQHFSVAVRELINHKKLHTGETSMHAACSDAGSFMSTTPCVPDTKSKERNAEQSSCVETDLDKELIDYTNCSAPHLLPETTSNEEKSDRKSSSDAEADSIHVHSQPEMENNKPKLSRDGEDESSIKERAANEIPKGKLARPHNPLFDDVSALDKSKLRKVVHQDRAQVEKLNERDTLLEQIRAKSFNLKPPMGSRPRVEAPRTNLRVAAILEKANAIRQALAGSDEDDEENWSDS